MSLIPSESHSFPDLEEGARSKQPKRESSPEDSAEPEKNPEMPPEVIKEEAPDPNINKTEEDRPTAPVGSIKTAHPTQPLPPKRTKPVTPTDLIINKTEEDRPAAPAGSIKTARPTQPLPPKRTKPVTPTVPVVPDQLGGSKQPAAGHNKPKSVPISTAEEDVSNYGVAGEQTRSAHRRRRNKLIRFVFFEGVAIAALLVFAKLEVRERFSGNSLTYLYGTAMFLSALAAAVIPVIFYALPPTLPPNRQ